MRATRIAYRILGGEIDRNKTRGGTKRKQEENVEVYSSV
jgi:hypothetical protein